MKRNLSRPLALSLAAAMLTLTACQSQSASETPDASQPSSSQSDASYEDAVKIHLSDDGVTVDGEAAPTQEDAGVYIAKDIVYYPTGKDFTFGEGEEEDTHEAAEADGHTVVHITQPGTYVLSGSLSAGQVAVDLGEDAEEDPGAVVTLVLNGVDITSTVAPAVIFYEVYECGSDDAETAQKDVDTSAAGANVIIADGSINQISGSYVARIYKPDSVVLSEDGTEVVDSKKLHKYDAAFYSKKSMNLSGGEKGDGVLNITAENEGLDSELHLTINGGNINITSGNDGINTNEDGVSVTTINGGSLNIVVDGSTGEGDGIDSNGWLVINGGTVTTSACSFSADAGIDSDMGIYLNGGTLMAGGNMLDRISGGDAAYAVFNFSSTQKGGTTYTLKDAQGNTAGEWTPVNDFSCLIVSGENLVPGTYTLWQGDAQLASGGGSVGGFPGGMGRPEGMTPPEGMEFPEGITPPEGMERPEPPEGMTPPDGMERPGRFDPADITVNEDGTVTLPDGTTVTPAQMGQRPNGGGRPGGKNGNMEGSPGELTTEFVLKEGGNTFGGITSV